ncbi:unnamed protein product [Malus baccata var. baccata]
MPIFMTHKALTELGFVCLVTWIAQVRLERMEVEIQFGKIKKNFMFEGFINGDFFAIQKMKWNACEELKILRKVFSPNSSVFFLCFCFLIFGRTSQAIRCDPRYQRQGLHSMEGTGGPPKGNVVGIP